MNIALCKSRGYIHVALAAGLGKVRRMYGRMRVGSGHDIMHTMTTGAIGRHFRASQGGKSVVAGEVRSNRIRQQPVLFVQSGQAVTGRAGLLRHIEDAGGRGWFFRRKDFVLSMTISAIRNVLHPLGQSHTMNTLVVFLRHVSVTGAAGVGKIAA